MADIEDMDRNKLLWHLDRVTNWMHGRKIIPIHIDAELSKGCSTKCEYCFGSNKISIDETEETKHFPLEPLLSFVKESGELGVKSISFVGEADPLLNPHVYDAIVEGKKAGVDIALNTNGIELDNGEKGISALKNLSWIRFNINEASNEEYQKVHGSNLFEKIINNIKFCVETKKNLNLPLIISLHMNLTSANVSQVISLSKLGKELGVNYLNVNQYPSSVNNGPNNDTGNHNNFNNIIEEAEQVGTENYNVTIKLTKNSSIQYGQCLGVPLLLYSSGDGKLFPCGIYFERNGKDFMMGDFTKESFKKIVESEQFWKVVEKIRKSDVPNDRYANCTTHSMNDFLWKIKARPPHVNFV